MLRSAQSEACKALVAEAVDVLGGVLDVVVNNAGAHCSTLGPQASVHQSCFRLEHQQDPYQAMICKGLYQQQCMRLVPISTILHALLV